MSDKSDKKSSGEKLLYCSFCGKSQHEVKKLSGHGIGGNHRIEIIL